MASRRKKDSETPAGGEENRQKPRTSGKTTSAPRKRVARELLGRGPLQRVRCLLEPTRGLLNQAAGGTLLRLELLTGAMERVGEEFGAGSSTIRRDAQIARALDQIIVTGSSVVSETSLFSVCSGFVNAGLTGADTVPEPSTLWLAAGGVSILLLCCRMSILFYFRRIK